MSELQTLARPYARAAHELAAAQGEVAAFSAALAFAAAVASDGRVAARLADPALSLSERIAVLWPSEGAPENFRRLLELLAENGRLPLLPQVQALYEERRAQAEGTLSVKVRSAAAIDDHRRDRLVSALARRYGRLVEIDIEIDPTLIAGAVIEAGGEVVDGSLATQLNRLRTELAA